MLFNWLDIYPLYAPADTLGAPAPMAEPEPEPIIDDPEPDEGGEPEADDAEIVDEDAGDPDAEPGEDEEEPEFDELDYAGTKLQIPKGTVPADVLTKIQDANRGFQADYTRKTQEVAEKAKDLETREGAVQKLATLNGDTLNLYAKGLHLQQEIAQLRNIDAQALWQSDPDQARQLSDVISSKQAELHSTANELSRKEQELTQSQAQELSRREAAGRQSVMKALPDFDESRVTSYVVKDGIPEAEAKAWGRNPQVAIYAHKAMLWDEMQAKAKKPAPKPAAQPVTTSRPRGKTGRRQFDPVRDADSMSADEWAKHERARMARLAKQNGAAR